MTLAEAPEVLTVSEAARLLRIGRNQTYQAIGRGDLYSFRLGRSIRIPRAAVQKLLAGDGA